VTSEDLEEELLFMEVDHALEDMPDLLPAGYPDSDDDESSDMEEDSGNEADDEEMLDQEEMVSRPRVAHHVRSTIENMYSTCCCRLSDAQKVYLAMTYLILIKYIYIWALH
jgi:hypothetical protein